MAVTAETPIASSVANGVTTVFPHSFTVLDADDFVATGTLAGVVTTYVEGVDFTLTGVGTASGSMVFGVAPANGTVVTRWRDTQIERTTDYQDNGDLLAGTVNADFNRLYYLFQEVFNGGKGVPTSLRVPNGETVNALPNAGDRANRVIAFDSSGQAVTIVGVDSGSAAALDLDLRSITSATKGAGQVGYARALAYSAGTVGKKLRELPTVRDFGAVGDGLADDSAARTAALAGGGIAHYAPDSTAYSVTTWNGTGGSTGTVVLRPNTWEADEAFANEGTIRVRRNTSTNKDAVKAEHYGSGTGYAVHAISYATNGSGVGGACWGIGAGLIGNKRGSGAGSVGNGVAGFAGIDNGGDQTGVSGNFSGSGSGGTGVSGKNEGTNVAGGNGGFFWRTGTGGGQGSASLRDGAGDGHGATITRTGSGAGDGVVVENSTTGSGSAVTATRKASSGGATRSIGYLGYWDQATSESAGVYGAVFAGTTQWAGKFDGPVRITGLTTLGGGAVPLVDGTGNIGSGALRFNTIYATVGAINTSDANEKTEVAALTAAEKRVAENLKAKVRSFRYWAALANKGQAARRHVGWLAQDVEAAFRAEGLDPAEYGMWCLDEITEEVDEVVGVEVYETPVEIDVEVEREEVELRGGVPVLVKTKTVEKGIKTKLVPLVDEAGAIVKSMQPVAGSKKGNPEVALQPVMVSVPVMKAASRTLTERKTKVTGYRQGLRMDQVLALVAAA